MDDLSKSLAQPRLRTAPPRRAYAEVANTILDSLRAEGLGPGSRLPPERRLAEQLNISRTTLREALAALEIVGVVETRVGAGTFVVASANFEWERWAAKADPAETLEARLLIEPRLAQLAARRWTRRTLAAVRRSLADLEATAPEHGRPTTLDREFHAAIAAAAGNSVLAAAVAPLRDLMSTAIWNASRHDPWTKQDTAQLVEEHKRIYEAIRDRMEDDAAFHMEAHLRRLHIDTFTPDGSKPTTSDRTRSR